MKKPGDLTLERIAASKRRLHPDNASHVIDLYQKDMARMKADFDALAAEYQKLEAERDRLRAALLAVRDELALDKSLYELVSAALNKYGDHLYECELKNGGNCSCGYETALTAGQSVVALYQQDIATLVQALRNIRSQIHNLPRSATADAIDRLVLEAIAVGERR